MSFYDLLLKTSLLKEINPYENEIFKIDDYEKMIELDCALLFYIK
jgi:hypothetical protein